MPNHLFIILAAVCRSVSGRAGFTILHFWKGTEVTARQAPRFEARRFQWIALFPEKVFFYLSRKVPIKAPAYDPAYIKPCWVWTILLIQRPEVQFISKNSARRHSCDLPLSSSWIKPQTPALLASAKTFDYVGEQKHKIVTEKRPRLKPRSSNSVTADQK